MQAEQALCVLTFKKEIVFQLIVFQIFLKNRYRWKANYCDW